MSPPARSPKRRLLLVLSRLAGLGALLWCLAAVTLDRVGARPPPEGSFDAIIVAGCRVEPDGQPSLALQRRTAAAVGLYHEGRAPLIILTGGVGRYPPSEAAAAASYAQSLGVPMEAMRLEDRSTSTEENARFAAEGFNGSRVLLVTDTYHVFRATRVFGRFFPSVTGVASVPRLDVRVKGALREVAAVTLYTVQGRL